MKRRSFARSMLGLSLAPFLGPARAASSEPADASLLGGAITDVL
jgi:hypothetical protein